MAFCSAVTLCFAAICAVVSAALLAIAFSTDNWQVISVDREKIKVSIRFLSMLFRGNPFRGHSQMTSVERGREGVGLFLTRGREVAWIWY